MTGNDISPDNLYGPAPVFAFLRGVQDPAGFEAVLQQRMPPWFSVIFS